MEITQQQIEEHIIKVDKGHIGGDWRDYGRCHICRFLAVENIGTDEAPQYFCRVCKTQYTKYSQ